MIGIVVVTHGQLARELVSAAETITGEDIPNATSVSIGWHDAPEDARRAIVAAVERVAGDSGAVVLTDMFGGTPTNLALSLLREGSVEVVTGVNLPMLIRLVSIREEEQVTPAAAARAAVYQGKENIYLASELLGTAPPPEDGAPGSSGESRQASGANGSGDGGATSGSGRGAADRSARANSGGVHSGGGGADGGGSGGVHSDGGGSDGGHPDRGGSGEVRSGGGGSHGGGSGGEGGGAATSRG